MKKVFQTIVDKGNGNCLQAAVASLFDEELDNVPHFIEFGDEWYFKLQDYFKSKGYDSLTPFFNTNIETTKNVMKHDQGVNGYFLASVKSQTFKNVMHSVIVDSNLKVVHDPNPNQKCLYLKPEGILEVRFVKNDWYVKDEKLFINIPDY